MSGELGLLLEREYLAAAPARRRRQDDPIHLSYIWDQLLKRFRAGDKAGYQARKYELGAVFSLLEPAEARELYERLRVRRPHDDLSRAFHHALHTSTRRRLLHILRLTGEGRPLDDATLNRILGQRRSAREFEERLAAAAPADLGREYQAPPARRMRQDDPAHLADIWGLLLQRFHKDDVKGYQKRKKWLGIAFSLLSPAQARDLYERIKVRRPHDDLSRAFYGALHPATVRMMLYILRLRAQGRPLDDAALDRIMFPYRYRSAREFEAGGWAERQLDEESDPRIQGICHNAGQLADRLRQDMRRAHGQPDPLQRNYTVQRIQRRGATWINRISGQLAPILGQFAPADLDRLVGCLARVEHAIGLETAPFRRLKAAARARLGP